MKSDSPIPQPTEVKLTAQGVLIVWDNSERHLLPYRPLRLDCRCANCVEEITGRKRLVDNTVSSDIIVVDYLTVGKYALQFLWSDGHETGIYPYTQLLAFAAGNPHSQ